MARRRLGYGHQRTSDREGHAHFVTFSCDRRRRRLDHDRPKRVVLGVLNSQLDMQDGRCIGFVVMPDHVHAVVRFPEPDQIVHFIKQWKQRSSVQIKRLARSQMGPLCRGDRPDRSDLAGRIL